MNSNDRDFDQIRLALDRIVDEKVELMVAAQAKCLPPHRLIKNCWQPSALSINENNHVANCRICSRFASRMRAEGKPPLEVILRYQADKLLPVDEEVISRYFADQPPPKISCQDLKYEATRLIPFQNLWQETFSIKIDETVQFSNGAKLKLKLTNKSLIVTLQMDSHHEIDIALCLECSADNQRVTVFRIDKKGQDSVTLPSPLTIGASKINCFLCELPVYEGRQQKQATLKDDHLGNYQHNTAFFYPPLSLSEPLVSSFSAKNSSNTSSSIEKKYEDGSILIVREWADNQLLVTIEVPIKLKDSDWVSRGLIFYYPNIDQNDLKKCVLTLTRDPNFKDLFMIVDHPINRPDWWSEHRHDRVVQMYQVKDQDER